MSSDNGWIIRNNNAGKFVLQHYFASADELPNVEDGAPELTFDTLETAVLAYQEVYSRDYPSEYGLNVHVDPALVAKSHNG